MTHRRYLLLFALGIAACSAPQDNIVLPLLGPPPPGGEEMLSTALFEGVLIVERGCVRVKSSQDGTTRTVLWHHGTEFDEDAAGRFLRNAKTGLIYRFGPTVAFGGGELTEDLVGREFPEFARRCGPPFATGYFPLRNRPQTRQVPPSRVGLRPNNSFKPKPLRG